MKSTTTTTTPAKVAKAKKTGFPRGAHHTPSHRLLPWPRAELAAVVKDLIGEEHEHGYLSDLVRGVRHNDRLKPTIDRAVEILNCRLHSKAK